MTKWLIDFDSTLSDTFRAIIPKVNETFGTSYQEEDFVSWASEHFMTPEHAAYMWGTDVFLNEDVQIDTPPVPHAIEGVRKLLDAGHELLIVSDRPMSLFAVTCAWLENHDLDIPVVFTHNKHSASAVPNGNTRTKAQVAWQHRLTHIVEDAPHHALSFAERSFVEKVYLLDYPHNRNVEHDNVIRVASWLEITP